MFRKKTCKSCGKKINEKDKFCPNCGNSVGKDSEGWGMLGTNDFEPLMEEIKLPFGFNTLFNSLVKNLDKQFSEIQKESIKNERMPMGSGISINISTLGDMPPQIKLNQFGNKAPKKKVQKEIRGIQMKNMSKKDFEKMSKLPKEEPKMEMKRLSDRIIYEIKMPKVKSLDNISVIKLENSIEVKALAEDKVYSRIIPVNLPIINCDFEEGLLILELGAR